MHPLLPATTAAEYGHRAALGLERHDHQPGVRASVQIDSDDRRDAILTCMSSPERELRQLDRHRVTEDAAEAIWLVLVHVARGWVVRRRLQRGESADWLLRDAGDDPVALEMSGMDVPDRGHRMRQKLNQVRGASAADQKAACVTVLATPSAELRSAGESGG